MVIRTARPEDADAVGRIRVSAWRSAYQEFLPADYLAGLDPRANLDGLRAALASQAPPFLLKIAELDREIVGFSILGKVRHATAPNTHEIWALNVDPNFWRSGVGKRLVQEALRCALEAGAARVELWCLKGNRAAGSLYEACGFSLAGVERTTSELTGHPLHEVCYVHAL